MYVLDLRTGRAQSIASPVAGRLVRTAAVSPNGFVCGVPGAPGWHVAAGSARPQHASRAAGPDRQEIHVVAQRTADRNPQPRQGHWAYG